MASIAAFGQALNAPKNTACGRITGIFAGTFCNPHHYPQVWKKELGFSVPTTTRPSVQRFRPAVGIPALWKTGSPAVVYTARSAARWARLRALLPKRTQRRETHLPAERAPPEAPARLPRTNGDPRRSRDPQAPARQGTQAPLRLRGTPQGQPQCSAATGSPAPRTSTRSTARGPRHPRGT